MAVIEFSRIPRRTDLLGRAGAWFVNIAGKAREWNDKRVTRIALSKLSEHELHDIGLSRDSIDELYR